MNLHNYCWIDKNKIYAEIYDELLDEDLSMNNKDHNEKIKYYIEKKILNSNFISISDNYNSNDDIISDLILKITQDETKKLQGNTILMFADSNSMYELFHMEDLTTKIPDSELNEFGSISNIHLIPVYWGCGIFKTSYIKSKNESNIVIKPTLITKQDIANIFIQNYYHIGVMTNPNGKLIEIEFTGEDPYKVIGMNFTQNNVINVLGFCLVPWIEKNEKNDNLNMEASEILGKEVYGRVFFGLVCVRSYKKFWNINTKTILNIIKILKDVNKYNLIVQELEQTDKDINPFYLLKKYLD